MFDLYNLLSSGYTADELATAFAQQLNDAEEQIAKEEEEKRAAEVAAAEAKARANEDAEKRASLGVLMYDFYDTLKCYYPDLIDEITDEQVEATVDLIVKMMDSATKAKTNTSLDMFRWFF